jgi:uncharacterized Tic20 family protein
MAWWRRMIEQGYMPSLTEARTLGQTAMFQGGKAAMAIDGSWQIGTYSATEGIRVGFSPQPAGPEGSWSMYNGLADAIWVGTKHPAEARKWVQFLASAECQRIVGTEAVVFPAIASEVDRAVATHRKRGVDVSAFLLPGRRAHDALPDHRQGAPDQPAGRAHAGEDPARQRGPCGGAEGRERRRQRAAGVRVMTSSTRAAAAAHLSSVAVALGVVAAAGRPVLWAGGAAFLGPLAARLALRDAFARRHAGAALRFNLSVALYTGAVGAGLALIPTGPYTVQLIPFLVICSLLIALNWLMFTLIAAHRAATGQTFTYPMTLGRS